MLLTWWQGGFNPSSIFVGGAKGIWLDPSDISTGFQDSAGTTPQTASGQPTGKRLDKSGNANHVLQATSNSRPEYDLISGIASDFFDAVDDNYATAAFGAGTLTNNMDCFLALRRSSGNIVMLYSAAGSGTYVGFANGASGAAANAGVGANVTYAVNGVGVPGGTATNATQLNTAAPADGAWRVVEIRNLDLSAWTLASFGAYDATTRLSGDLGGLILCPAQSSANRDSLRRWLGAKVGLSL